jgi:hypothetical protein
VIASALDHVPPWRQYAAEVLFDFPPKLRQIVVHASTPPRFHTKLVPLTLRDALFHQAAEAITGNYQWLRCGNDGCLNWLHIGGLGGVTKRAKYCSPRCNAAASYKRRKGTNSDA